MKSRPDRQIRAQAGRFLLVLFRSRTYRTLVFFALAAPLAVGGLALLLIGLAVGTLLVVVGVGIPLLGALPLLAGRLAQAEGALVWQVLRTAIPGARAAAPIRRRPQPWLRRLRDPYTWQAVTQALLEAPLAALGLAAAGAAVAAFVSVAAVPVLYRDEHIALLGWDIDTATEAGLWALPALLGGLALLHVATALGAANARLTRLLLEQREASLFARLAGASPAPAFKRLILGALFLLLVIGAGVAGYVTIADFPPFDALYQTVLTVTTIGFQEVHPLDTAGRSFTMVLAVLGVGTVLYILATLGQLLLEGELARDVVAWRVNRQINGLRGHFVICGLGRAGTEVAEELDRRGQAFVAIDPDASAADRARRRGWLFLRGDASTNDVLAAAQITHARACIVAGPSDAANTFMTLTARRLNPEVFVVARANEVDAESILRTAGAERVVSAPHIAGRQMARWVLDPAIASMISALSDPGPADHDVLAQAPVWPGSRWEGACLRDVTAAASGVTVLALRRREGLIIGAAAETVLAAGDQLMVVARADALERFAASSRGQRPPAAAGRR